MEAIAVVIIALSFFVASFFGSMVGGGGLLTVPVLIFMGLSPHTALGTSKIGAFGNTFAASVGYGRGKKTDYRTAFLFMAFAVLGGIAGTFMILSIPQESINKILAFVMIAVSIFLLVKRDFGMETKEGKRNAWLLILYGLASGFFTGFFGPGIGIINRFVLSSVFAYSLINSAAISTFANSATTLVSFFIFLFNGAVNLSLMAPILLMSLLGGYLGSRHAIKSGDKYVKNLLVTVSIIMAIALLFF